MSLKIVFMGTPKFSVPTLNALIKNKFNILNVYTQPPKKSKRGQKINASEVEEFVKKNKINIKTPENLNNEKELDFFNKLSPDIAVVVAYGQIIPKEILSLTKKGFINIHASLLPKWRGAAPIQRSIMNLDKQTGISIMKIDEKLDSGPVCNSYKLNVMHNDNAEVISDKLSALAAEKFLDNIDEILEDKMEFKEQNHEEATYADKIKKSEGKIDWNNSAENIIGKINGLYQSPGAWFIYNGERYKVLKAEIGNGMGKIGSVLNDYLEISCSNKSLKILEIQREGKRPQNTKEFVLGSQIKKGSNLNNA